MPNGSSVAIDPSATRMLQVTATFVETATGRRLRSRLPLISTVLGDRSTRSTLLTSRLTWSSAPHCHQPRRGDIGYHVATGRLLLYGEDAPCARGVELVGRVESNLEGLTSARSGSLLQIDATTHHADPLEA